MMHESIGDDDIVLDLTPAETEGFELIFEASISYLRSLRQQVLQNEIDKRYAVCLEFENIHPVAARVDNYLQGTEYDSIGTTEVGRDKPRQIDGPIVALRVRCERCHLRRFAHLNRIRVEYPITFTVEIPSKKAKSFTEAVGKIQEKYKDSLPSSGNRDDEEKDVD